MVYEGKTHATSCSMCPKSDYLANHRDLLYGLNDPLTFPQVSFFVA